MFIDQTRKLGWADGGEVTEQDAMAICARALTTILDWKAKTEDAFRELAKEQEETRRLRSELAVARTDTNGVWRWQGDGEDHPESLSCPVVMSAATLRAMLERQAHAVNAAKAAIAALGHLTNDDDAEDIQTTDEQYADAVRKIGLLAFGDREKMPPTSVKMMADELADLLRSVALGQK